MTWVLARITEREAPLSSREQAQGLGCDGPRGVTEGRGAGVGVTPRVLA